MKRRRSSAPGRRCPDGRWSLSSLLAAYLAIVLVACGQATATDQPTAPGQPSSEAPAPTDSAATGPSTGAPSEGPSVSAAPQTPEPTATTTAGSSGDPAAGIGSAAPCSGSDENRDFFASMAAAVDWMVYCPVVPDRWFVDDGQYRLAGGGWMEISYDGPGDARIVLRQGAFCGSDDGCVPAGSELGETAFGDRTGTLVAGIDGSWAVVVDRGATMSWLLVVHGLDESSARTIAADLHGVSG